MQKPIEHEPEEQRAWKLHTTLNGIWYYTILFVSVPTTLYLGYLGVGAILNGVRDWWHYNDGASNPGAWVYIGVFVVAGLAWMYALHALGDYKDTHRFNEYVRSRRLSKKLLADKLARPTTRWEKITGWLAFAWFGSLILALIYVKLLR